MPYKVYIVDDEPMIRYGISSSINWQEHNLQLIGEASNGKIALDFLVDNSVDILISDIKMPIMDGLTLISELKHLYPHLQAILISSYNEFDYAREALRLGVVVDYLLKPTMEPENLIACIAKCVARLQQSENESRMHTQLVESTYKESLRVTQDQIFDWFTQQQLNLNEKPDWFAQPIYLASWSLSSHEQTKIIHAAISSNFSESLFILMSPQHVLSIVPERDNKSLTLLSKCHEQLIKNECPSYLVISPLLHDWKKLKHAYDIINIEREQQFYNGDCRIVVLHHLNMQVKQYENQFKDLSYKFTSNKEQLLAAISKKDLTNAEMHLKHILEIWHSREISIATIRGQAQSLYSLFSTVQYPKTISSTIQAVALKLKTIAEASTLSSIAQLLEQTLHMIMQLPHDSISIDENAKSTYTIQHAILYINETFREELSLQKVADYVHLSKNYFSEQFKKITGMNYMDYVITLRIQYAKHLLATTNMKINEIGEQSGFNSPKHFLKIFKREVHCTPVEYRQQQTKQIYS